ncbi:MAG: hypothetical protein JNJ58_06035 [Chitinophagaceae bacterium]|nr:hypothetical protein [Chitinophagaceae bacterium]
MKQLLSLLTILLISHSLLAQGYRVNRNDSKTSVKLKKEDLGKNIIAFSPVHIVATDIESDQPDVTIAMSYERIFNNEMISVKLPVNVALTRQYFYIMPTIKLYPKKQGVAKYAIGPQLLFGTGMEEYQKFITGPNGIVYSQFVTERRNQFGFFLNNSVNFTIARALYVALDFGLGVKYYDSAPRNTDMMFSPFGNSGISPSFQLGFNMGYRF